MSSKLASANNLPTSAFISPSKIVHYNTQKDRLYASKCICLISQHPFNRAFSKILHTLYDMVEKTDLLGISLESHLHSLIYGVPLPPAGHLLRFHVGCTAVQLHLPDYTHANDLPLLDYDMFEFFRLLGVSNAINLYVAALLEHQILLYSKEYHLLMLVAETLTALFFPFTWLKPYVPIVPASNLHFIEAPVPYIMGFHHRDIDKEFFKQGQRCFVDIDSGTVSCPEGLPEFPDKNKFVKEISDLAVYFSERRSRQRVRSAKPTLVSKCGGSGEQNKIDAECDKISNLINGGDNEEASSRSNMDEADGERTESSAYDILQSSQAFTRITELARKTGAINGDDEYFVDSTTGIESFLKLKLIFGLWLFKYEYLKSRKQWIIFLNNNDFNNKSKTVLINGH